MRASIFPGATHSGASWYADNFGGAAMNVDAVVLHTTEGFDLPGYAGGAMAPTLTGVPNIAKQRIDWVQHFPFETSARALRNLIGNVQTNTADVAQVELVGTCDPAHRRTWGSRKAGIDYIFWPEAPEWALREVAKLVAWAYKEHAVPLIAPKRFDAYPASIRSVRMSYTEWRGVRGWVGHQHVPENVHGDPGNIDVNLILAMARDIVSPSKAVISSDPRLLLHLQRWLRSDAGRIPVGATGDAAGALNRFLGYGGRTVTAKTIEGAVRALKVHGFTAEASRVASKHSVGRGAYEALAKLSATGKHPYTK